MNLLRLPQFLKIIDERTKEMSREELERFIHEMARVFPEEKRSFFLAALEGSISTAGAHEKASGLPDDGYEEIRLQIQRALSNLEAINNGEKCLDSEYNQEYDDWYNDSVDEILFLDPQKVMPEIKDAILLVHKCVDMELFREGFHLCEKLCNLEVTAEGDYMEYECDLLGIDDLYAHGLLAKDQKNFAREALYLAYMGNELPNRAEKLFDTFMKFHGVDVCLEELLQMGNRELPDAGEFLSIWFEYLCNQQGYSAETLLKEARGLLQDEAVLLEHARTYVKEHPSLYLQLLEQYSESGENEKLLNIGREALERIPVQLEIRSRIALCTAEYAWKAGKTDVMEQCWLEALRSDTSMMNYMRLKFLPEDPERYAEQVWAIIEAGHVKPKREWCTINSSLSSERETWLSDHGYCAMLFFEQKFNQMEQIGMSTEEALGWSSTFMKEGIALLMILLFRGNRYPKGMYAMIDRARMDCSFHKEEFYRGTGEKSDLSDTDVFTGLLEKWKKTVVLSDADAEAWMKKLAEWIHRRVVGIMEANRRNYYGECAAFIAAYGEVKESLGESGAKLRIMEAYKNEYSRRRTFRDALSGYIGS